MVAAVVAAMSLYSIIVFRKLYPVQLIKYMWVALISSVFMGIVVWMVSQKVEASINNLTVLTGLGALSYALSVFVLGRDQFITQLAYLFPKLNFLSFKRSLTTEESKG